MPHIREWLLGPFISISNGTCGIDCASKFKTYRNCRKSFRRTNYAVLRGCEVLHGVATRPTLCLLGSAASLRLRIMNRYISRQWTGFFGRWNISALILRFSLYHRRLALRPSQPSSSGKKSGLYFKVETLFISTGLYRT